MVLQAALPDGLLLDLLSRFQDLRAAAIIDVGGREVAEALVVAAVVVVLDEGADLPFEVSWQEVVFQQDAVLQGLVPAFDLAMGLGMVRRAADVLDAAGVQVVGEVRNPLKPASRTSLFRSKRNPRR